MSEEAHSKATIQIGCGQGETEQKATIMEIEISGVIGAIIGFLIAYKLANGAYKELYSQIESQKNNPYLNAPKVESSVYLDVLRRELANHLMVSNPDRMLRAYDKVLAYQEDIEGRTAEFRQRELDNLTERFSQFFHFDLIQARHFVTFEEGLVANEDEIVDRYFDISRFMILEPSSFVTAASESEREILKECIQEQKDKRLREGAKTALQRYQMATRLAEKFLPSYEDDEYTVCRLPVTTPGTDYGICVKSTMEYAIYEVFHGDDKIYRSVYRSDEQFNGRRPLLV